MTQHNDRQQPRSQKSLLFKSLSWISVISILSCNQVLAQTESASDNIVPLPTAEVAPPPATPSQPSVVRLQRALAKPKVVRPEAVPQPRVSTYVAPKAKSPVRKTAIQKTQDYNGAFIDPTDYNTGATSTYEAPSQVIFSQRSPSGKSQRQTIITTNGNSVQLSTPQKPQQNASWVRNSRVATAAIFPVRANTSKIRYTNRLRSPINRQKAVNNVVTLPKIPVSSYYNRTIRPTGMLGNDNTNMIFPLPIPATITSLFGWRIHPITGDRRFHSGTDFGASMGTPVVAAYSGNVATADLMPQVDGYTLLSKIREIKGVGQIPAIALSAFAKEEDVQKSLEAGFSRHLTKPIEPTELVKAVSEVLIEINTVINK